ncbi:NAD(P)H dehydrogenase (quinone) [Rhizobium paknamense]|uniref:NAD(P)H dehydrogenase (Quinone) n=2 Tax=Rhizobium paknamense TaxID=1206817 RepID=A0ABU0I9E7_9HYPH|nr:NAD(P)H dehydrogenase (quinone) [Rhizobium paknamense]
MSKILVTGASGKLGTLVIRHLLKTENVAPGNIVAASRDPAKLAALQSEGVETRRADFTDPGSLSEAFKGIDRLLIISTDAIGSRVPQHEAAVAGAIKAGVTRLFYTSMFSPETSKVSFAPEHQASEAAIKASGLAYSIFRNGWYMENLFNGLPAALASGNWYNAAGEGGTSYIARDDIARAMAAELANPADQSTIYTLSGGHAYSKAEIAALARTITGKPLAVVDVTEEQLAGGLKAAGIPEAFIPVIVSVEAATRAGNLATVTPDAEKLARTPLQSLKDFLEANKAAL